MSKLLADATCPGCGKDHQVEVDLASIPKAKRVQIEKDDNDDVSKTLKSIQDEINELKKPKAAPPEEKPKERPMPPLSSYIPKFKCKDGNCEVGNHKNPNYKQRPKSKCANCDQFNPHAKGKCLWCDKEELEELEPEELEELGIPLPPSSEHEGHNHE